ncbi:MAG TPA: hypothetical protein VK177_09700 [Flavobacteriales bacterium]|nr:hypothetical protein [Flavobacteriales bacterium]
MSNILFTYCYRTATNEKTSSEIIFSNPDDLSMGDIEYKLKSRLIDQEYFNHSDFMVPPLYGEYPDFDKNPTVHEFLGVALTNSKENDKRTISDFITNIK